MIDSADDRSAWLRVALERYEQPLVRYAARLTGNLETGRDVVQDVFLRLVQQQAREDVDDHLRQWLFAVCRNRSLDVLRKEGRMHTLSDEHAGSLASTTRDGRLDEGSRSTLSEHLERLPARQQELIRLKFQHGLSYKEIASVTELTVSNVGFLIHCGVKTLREALRPQIQQTPGIAR